MNIHEQNKDELIKELLKLRKENDLLKEELLITNKSEISKKGFTTLTEAISTPIFIIQGEKIVYFNKAAKNLVGYSEEEFFRFNFWDFVHPDFRNLVKNRGLARLKGDAAPQNYELMVIAKDGSEKRLDYTAGVFNWNGKPAIIGSALDITKRKETEEELLKFKLCIQGSFEATFITDLDGNFTYANPAFEKIYGFNSHEIIGKTPRILKSGTYTIDVYKHFWDTLLLKEVVSGEIINKTKDGRLITVEAFNTSILDPEGKIYGFIGIHRDITEQKRSEESLRLFRELIDQSNDIIEVVDVETGNFIDVNERGCVYLGYSREDFLKLSVWDVDPMVDKSLYKKIIEQLKISGSRMWEGRHKRNDGTTFPVEVNIKIVSLDKDYVVSVVRDITQRKKSEESVRKLSLAVEQSPVSIIITDKKGNIEYINPKVTETSGYQPKEVIGFNPRIFASGEKTKSEYKELWENICSGKEWRGEFRNKKKTGELYWEFASISSITNQKGEITHFVSVKEDITIRKQKEKELILAKNKAEESDRLKSAFLATMSHELRTPLNAIIGFSEIIDGDLPVNEIIEYIEIIHSNGNQLLRIVEDIFDITLIVAGEKEIFKQKFELKSILSIVRETIKVEQHRLKKNDLDINFVNSAEEEEIIINTDRSKLKQILINLLKNAIKFTDKGHINYGYTLINYNGKPELRFYVEDTGIGISKDKLGIVFEMFRQVEDSHIRQFEGTGIGLFISKRLVELLGGRIRVESNLGKGTTFYFTIPA